MHNFFLCQSMMMTNMAQTIVNALDERLEQIVGNVVSPTRSEPGPKELQQPGEARTCKHQ